ncbi:MAG: HPr family phosphocarrier protein [Planctomycetaceae bacterium]|jgi:phosphocarrier protein HPr|nr:HPr family phosphocarrier protein [Planctomycetaceae bacterium]
MTVEHSAHRRVVIVQNEHGLHIRPCSLIAATAQKYQSTLTVTNGTTRADGKRVLELMTLGALPGTELELLAIGADAPALLDEVSELFAGDFMASQPVTTG